MYLHHLSLINFKNLEEVDLQLSPGINCFIGNNGVGKTNLMDAVYYLSFCKSFLNSIDYQNITRGRDFFVIQGDYMRDEQEEHISCGLKNGEKKNFRRNRKLYRKLAEHIGLLPLVVVTPSDIELITGGSDGRRRFIDGLISQYDAEYLVHLIRYNRALQQRNKLLKQFEGQAVPYDMVEVWDEQMTLHGRVISERRIEFLRDFQPVFQTYYELISGGNEPTCMLFESPLLAGDFAGLLKASYSKDLLLQHTTVGIHKDDVRFELDGFPIRKLGSEGQKKTYLVALKLAQFDFIRRQSGQSPILLLDDIFDKLDANRVRAIVQLVEDAHFGQIFITDTNREHLDGIIREITSAAKFFVVAAGTVKEVVHAQN
ncbi:MAG: DNA replication/repair protein RecF [Bacteroidales bacterium]|jgi:DNA replication and repair protein RecF|nr:DNA replication/repair protein RecF [Bacteroidales bacterium]